MTHNLHDEVTKLLEELGITEEDIMNLEISEDIDPIIEAEDIFDVPEDNGLGFSTTQTIKGNVINLKYVESIEKIEKEHNETVTYGVKFNFTGKKKFYRIVWFNTNVQQRDLIYNKETNFLNQIQQKQEG